MAMVSWAWQRLIFVFGKSAQLFDVPFSLVAWVT
jgi:hypothetical protein